MKAAPKSATPTKKKVEPVVSHRPFDIAGVIFASLAVVAIVSLLTAESGFVGQTLSGVLTTLFGRGAWAAPVFFVVMSVAMFRGRKWEATTHLGWGLGLIFIAALGLMTTPIGRDYFDVQAVASGGGYIGAIVGWAFASMLGVAKPVGLGAVALIGTILCLDVPLRNFISSLRGNPARGAITPVADRAVQSAPRALKSIVSTDLIPAEEELPDRKPARREPVIRDAAPALTLSQDVAVPKEGYQLPPLSLLAEPVVKPKRSVTEMQRNIETLEGTLEQFGIEAQVVEVATGPTVTRYEIQLGPGVKVARIVSLADNIAMNLAAPGVRLEAPIPNKNAIGVEVPNSNPTTVMMREVCETAEFQNHPSRLFVALGQDVSGKNQFADLTRMPHLLIGGATNSGKSIGLATLITSLLMRNTPKDVRMVMIDPKRVELSLFDGIPHLMCPVIKDVKEAPGVLRAIWREMDRRYDQLSQEGVRNIQSWNERASFQDRMPYIVVVIDELADLMMTAGPEVETCICRLAQLARATGIHLVIATQRPSVDVITGTIKANIPSRIAFSVSSHIDSRTIIDAKGAETLIGRGDMMFLPIESNKSMRIQGCYVSEKEIEAVCRFWREQESPAYTLEPVAEVADATKEAGDFGNDGDPLWEEAVRWVCDRGQASTSMLQRRFSVGFQRASRILDMMEERGIVAPRDGPRPREVLMTPLDADGLFGTAPKYDVEVGKDY
ncbi:MAG: DNA translocase FtsK 4TM domain-containing protein [Fimbriimonas sp.]